MKKHSLRVVSQFRTGDGDTSVLTPEDPGELVFLALPARNATILFDARGVCRHSAANAVEIDELIQGCRPHIEEVYRRRRANLPKGSPEKAELGAQEDCNITQFYADLTTEMFLSALNVLTRYYEGDDEVKERISELGARIRDDQFQIRELDARGVDAHVPAF